MYGGGGGYGGAPSKIVIIKVLLCRGAGNAPVQKIIIPGGGYSGYGGGMGGMGGMGGYPYGGGFYGK